MRKQRHLENMYKYTHAKMSIACKDRHNPVPHTHKHTDMYTNKYILVAQIKSFPLSFWVSNYCAPPGNLSACEKTVLARACAF